MRPSSILKSVTPGPIRARRTTNAANHLTRAARPKLDVTTAQDTLLSVYDPVSVADATALLDEVRSGSGGDELGSPVGRPILVVDLDQVAPDARLCPPPGWPCVLVATSTALSPPRPPDGPDVLISAAADPPPPWVGVSGRVTDAARAVEEAVRRNPQAATTLAQVLRAGSKLGPGEALVVESLAYSTLQAGPEHGAWLAGRAPRAADDRTDPAVAMDRHEGVLWITLDRPERRNAYSARMRDELVAALEVAGADPTIRAVHLRGRGPNFCSGGDLGEFGTLPDPSTAHGIRTLRSAGWRMSQLASRMTVHLHGACVGAGIELAAFAGTVEATEDATVSLPEISMGLVPGAGGTASIPRRIGPSRTAWLALTGSRLDASTAHRWRLVDRLVPAQPLPRP
jgi:enoyl-CoA hydratase/carnithine racemase